MSVLLPETCRMLWNWSKTRASNPVIRDRGEEDAKLYGELRVWLESQPHTAECRCVGCRKKAAE
jgi:hypothetical protein